MGELKCRSGKTGSLAAGIKFRIAVSQMHQRIDERKNLPLKTTKTGFAAANHSSGPQYRDDVSQAG